MKLTKSCHQGIGDGLRFLRNFAGMVKRKVCEDACMKGFEVYGIVCMKGFEVYGIVCMKGCDVCVILFNCRYSE